MNKQYKAEAVFHAVKEKKSRPEEDDRSLGWNLVHDNTKIVVDGAIVKLIGVELQNDDEVVITVHIVSRVKTGRVKL